MLRPKSTLELGICILQMQSSIDLTDGKGHGCKDDQTSNLGFKKEVKKWQLLQSKFTSAVKLPPPHLLENKLWLATELQHRGLIIQLETLPGGFSTDLD